MYHRAPERLALRHVEPVGVKVGVGVVEHPELPLLPPAAKPATPEDAPAAKKKKGAVSTGQKQLTAFFGAKK